MTTSTRLTQHELERLTKSQLIAFIMKNMQPCNEGEAKLCIEEPPADFSKIALPPKPVLGVPAPPPGPGAPPPLPACPPVPDNPAMAGVKKKKALPPEDVSGTKKIFVKCERCDKTFIIDLPRVLVLSNPLEVVPVTILHAPEHALTVYLDQNFESRRDYISELFTIG